VHRPGRRGCRGDQIRPVGDARSDWDITSVQYHNGPRSVSARVQIPGLEHGGAVRLWIAPPGADDFGYGARLELDPFNRLKFALLRWEPLNPHYVRCSTGGAWSIDRGFVVVTVPQACLPGLGRGPLYLFASSGRQIDKAPPAVVRRG
jgi:hypothetical protein